MRKVVNKGVNNGVMGKPPGRTKDKHKGKTYAELGDEDKFKVISMYSRGSNYKEIASVVGISGDVVKNSISVLIKELTLVQESRKLSTAITLPSIT